MVNIQCANPITYYVDSNTLQNLKLIESYLSYANSLNEE